MTDNVPIVLRKITRIIHCYFNNIYNHVIMKFTDLHLIQPILNALESE